MSCADCGQKVINIISGYDSDGDEIVDRNNRFTVDGKTYQVCNKCRDAWLRRFPELYRKNPWFVALFRINMTVTSDIDVHSEVVVAKRYDALPFGEENIPNDLFHNCQTKNMVLGGDPQVVGAHIGDALDELPEPEEITPVLVFGHNEVTITELISNSDTRNTWGLVICLGNTSQRIARAMKELLIGGLAEVNPSDLVTVCPSLPQSRQDFHYWTMAKKEAKKLREAAKELEDEARHKFLEGCAWPVDREVACILTDIAQLPTTVISIILTFANPDTAVQFDASLHSSLLSRKRRRCTIDE
jgi:hypothetical protein